VELPGEVREMVCRGCRVAVVGASPSPDRPVHSVMGYLLSRGFDLYPVNPRYAGEEIWGIRCLSSLSELPGEVDVVDVFVNPSRLPEVVEEVKALPYRPVVWLQPGAEREDVAESLRSGGYTVVSGICLKVAHMSLCAKG